RGPAAGSSQREVLPPRIHSIRSCHWRHEALFGQAPKHLIERSRRRVEPATGLFLHVLADRVSVRWALAEREEDVKGQIGERLRGLFIRHAPLDETGAGLVG